MRPKRSSDEILEIVIKTIPYPQHIDAIKTYDDHIRFTWRGDRFRVSDALFVEQVEKGCLSGGNLSILLQSMLRKCPPLA